jgi:hypothetical protein
LVGFHSPAKGEFVLCTRGRVVECTDDGWTGIVMPVIRKAAAVCVWPRGVFKDGWLVQDADETMYLYLARRPSFSDSDDQWVVLKCEPEEYVLIDNSPFVNPPVFRADLPFEKRIQKVGPAVEKAGGEVADVF